MHQRPKLSSTLGVPVWTRVHRVLALAILVVPLAPACGLGTSADDACTADTWRCDGDHLQICTAHPGGPTGGGLDDIHVQKGSASTWTTDTDCGPGRCISPTDRKPFCALDAARSPLCATPTGFACDGTSLVQCLDGFPVARARCKSCSATSTCFFSAGGTSSCCPGGGVDSSCTGDGDCADGLHCKDNRCAMPCDCADGTACPACNVLYTESTRPESGKALTWTCRNAVCVQD